MITFETEVLKEDVAVCGHIYADLYVSSNCTDTDFMVKIEDVSTWFWGWFNWTADLLIDTAMGMKWRKGMYTPPNLMEPNSVYNVLVDVWHTCKVFEKGHRIRVAI